MGGAPMVWMQAPPMPVVSSWTPLAVGLGVIALVGLASVVVYLLVRRKDGTIAPVQLQGATLPSYMPTPPIYLINAGGGGGNTSAQVTSLAPVQATSTDTDMHDAILRMESAINNWSRPPAPSLMQTLTLPVLSDRRATAVRLGQATTTMFDAVLRVVGPAGSFAAFSTDPTEVNRPDMPAIPTGNVVIVPSGQFHSIRLRPREAVYGKGSVAGVLVSVTCGEAGGRIYG